MLANSIITARLKKLRRTSKYSRLLKKHRQRLKTSVLFNTTKDASFTSHVQQPLSNSLKLDEETFYPESVQSRKNFCEYIHEYDL